MSSANDGRGYSAGLIRGGVASAVLTVMHITTAETALRLLKIIRILIYSFPAQADPSFWAQRAFTDLFNRATSDCSLLLYIDDHPPITRGKL